MDRAVDASSFRLDQPLMDRLIGQFPHARARIFLRAFFPEAVASLSAYEQAAQAHEQALAKLVPVLEASPARETCSLSCRTGAAALSSRQRRSSTLF